MSARGVAVAIRIDSGQVGTKEQRKEERKKKGRNEAEKESECACTGEIATAQDSCAVFKFGFDRRANGQVGFMVAPAQIRWTLRVVGPMGNAVAPQAQPVLSSSAYLR